jgi:hypothetical protein
MLNGHESYYSVNFKLYYKENDIIILYMPAYLSYILQPLNVGCFSPLKKAYGR